MRNKQFKVGDLVEVWTVTKGENVGVIVDIATIGGLHGTRHYWVRFPTRLKEHGFLKKHLKLLTK